jgi:hypothetical protein
MASQKIFGCGEPFFIVPKQYVVIDEDVFNCNWHRWVMGLPAKSVIGGFESRNHTLLTNSFIGSEEFMTRLQAQGNTVKALRMETRKGAIVLTHLLGSKMLDTIHGKIMGLSSFATQMEAMEKRK